jgi:DNA polymerase-1
MKDLYLIDASGYIYRSYFAIPHMTNDQGESTNALFGFVRSLLKLFKDFHPDHCVAVFDGPHGSRSRTAIYSAYKAHRAKMPPDLLHQIEWAQEFCTLFGIPMLAVEGVEADDTMSSIALWAAKKDTLVYLCSTDKDLCQLVNDQISMLDTFKENTLLKAKEVEQKFGVAPHLIGDLLALMGDASDNVPGVPGIGPKTAAELLKQFGSLEGLLKHAEQLTGKKRELIEKHREDALLSRKLVTLDTSVDFPHDAHFFSLKPLQKEALKAFYTSKKFNTLIRELEASEPAVVKAEPSAKRYHLVDDEKSLHALLEKLAHHSAICIDTVPSSAHPMRAELIGVGLGVDPDEAWYIPLNGQLGKEKALKLLRPFITNPKRGFYGHDLKYDYHVLYNAGIPLNHIVFDTILASYLLKTHTRKHSLDELALETFGHVMMKESDLVGKGKKQIAIAEAPLEKVASYCCESVTYAIRLKNQFQPEIEKRELHKLYYELELPLLKVLAQMEQAGIYLDKERLEEFGKDLRGELKHVAQEIYRLAHEEFNLNSPQQISNVLFKKLHIPPPKGTSTSAEVLESLKWDYPIAGKIQNYRVLEKLRSTYVEVLPSEINPKTNRIHCTFNQSVAATGRLSCQDPNLQNIPVRSEVGLRIREAFKPQKKGWSYISADYSQIELRLLAHLSEDPILLEAFRHHQDIHRLTAAAVFHVPIDLVSKEMRDKSKAVNFGIIYGQGAFGLSQGLGIPQKEAAQFIAMYFKQYPKVKEFLEACKDRARVTGKAVTITGRERAIPEILSQNIMIRNAAERLAVNTPFQGSAADLIKKAMLEIQEEIEKKKLQGFMILQIHDELIFEVPDDEIEIFKKLVKDKMEHVIKLKVPLAVDVSVGKNWKEC